MAPFINSSELVESLGTTQGQKTLVMKVLSFQNTFKELFKPFTIAARWSVGQYVPACSSLRASPLTAHLHFNFILWFTSKIIFIHKFTSLYQNSCQDNCQGGISQSWRHMGKSPTAIFEVFAIKTITFEGNSQKCNKISYCKRAFNVRTFIRFKEKQMTT